MIRFDSTLFRILSTPSLDGDISLSPLSGLSLLLLLLRLLRLWRFDTSLLSSIASSVSLCAWCSWSCLPFNRQHLHLHLHLIIDRRCTKSQRSHTPLSFSTVTLHLSIVNRFTSPSSSSSSSSSLLLFSLSSPDVS
jgi:hypothetical protein